MHAIGEEKPSWRGWLGRGWNARVRTAAPTLLAATVAALCAGGPTAASAAQQPFTVTVMATAVPAHAGVGQPVAVYAAVACTSGVPAGTVTFLAGAAVLGTPTLRGGRAELTTALLPSGRHEVSARYNGDEDCPRSTSESVTVTVVPGRYQPAAAVGQPLTTPEVRPRM
jgi:hypothetical protein